MKRRGFLATLTGWLAWQKADRVIIKAAPATSNRDPLIARLTRIRAGGSPSDGPWLLSDSLQIGAADYALMGADNACGRIRAESLGHTANDARDGKWYRLDENWRDAPHFYNSHATKVGERWVTEAAYLGTVHPQFQVSAEEVVWHHLRRLELIEKGVTDQNERVRMMTEERRAEPWRQ